MKNILFVCTGNTCRSPMAEALLKNKSKHLDVKSAGVFAGSGSPASSHSIEVLKAKGIECHHESTQLDDQLVDWADLILTMTTNHKQVVMASFPRAADKTFTLKEYTIGQDEDIVDPFGGALEVYRITMDELELHIDKLLKKLQ